MITLTAKHTYELDRADLRQLEALLHTQLKNLRAFFEEENGQDILQLLEDGHVPNALAMDWKWDAGQLFADLQNLLPTHQLNLLNASQDSSRAYTLHFAIDGQPEKMVVDYSQPAQIFEAINAHLQDGQFIQFLTESDEYAWLLVPADFDVRTFCTLTGCRLDGEPEEVKPVFHHYIDPEEKLTEPFLVNMHIYGRKGNKPTNPLLQFVFTNEAGEKRDFYRDKVVPGNRFDDTWGKTVPGDTFSETVHEILTDHFGCSHMSPCNSWHFVQDTRYAGKLADDKDVTYNCLDVYVSISYFSPGAFKVRGWGMKWKPAVV